jgi:hypothetical protein
MLAFVSCCPSLASLSRGFAKATAARLRSLGISRRAAPDIIDARLRTCSRCPLAVVHKGATYCGTPLLQKLVRQPEIDGCGCPLSKKAADPDEHCPIDAVHSASRRDRGGCSCKWCHGRL